MAIAPGTPLWRYTHLIELELVLRDRELRMTRVDQFPDPFEGSVPAQQIEDQGVIFRGGALMRTAMDSVAAHHPGRMALPPHDLRDPYELMTIRRKAAARSVHASCWTMAQESEPRWRQYCTDGAPGQGVAMRTTYERLEASVAHHHLIVRGIDYRHYHVGPAFRDDLAPFLHKRQNFQDEEEVRVLNYNEHHRNQLAYALTADGRYGPPPPQPAELPTHIFLGWQALGVVDGIIVSPYATAAYEQRVRDTLAAIDTAAGPLIQLSRFNERSSDPLF